MSGKQSTGPNARPKDQTIAQSGEGLPDDSSGVPRKAREADEEAARRSLAELGEEEEGKETSARKRRKSEPERAEEKTREGDANRRSGR